MIFGIKHTPLIGEALKKEALLNKIEKGLKDTSLKTMFVNGFIKRDGDITIFKIEPLVSFNPFWIGVIWFSIFIILQILIIIDRAIHQKI
jgi:hypothetical protein